MSCPRSDRATATAMLLILLALLSGCAAATTTGQARTAMTDGLEQASSAVETAALTVTLLDDGRVTAPVADTALLDQIRVLDEASAALTTLVPPTELATPRADATAAVGAASDAVVSARSWVNGESTASSGEVLDALEAAASELDDALAGVGS